MNTMQGVGKTVIAAVLGGCISLGAYKVIDKDDENQRVIIEKVPENYSRTASYTTKNGVNLPQIDFTGAAEKVTPAVVHIRSTMDGGAQASQRQIPIPEPFRDFFGDEGLRGQSPSPAMATGSGVIISKDGYIVTNNHVIDDASKLEVTLYDERSFPAKVIGTDPTTDLALIKIEGKDLPTLPLGNSDDVKVGQWVLAVGNPFNLSSTVTAGIVSAKGRSIGILGQKERERAYQEDPNNPYPINSSIESFIQTDAAVNPGNSGGALVNVNGELVGINTAIASETGSYAGYAFAVPASIVSKVVEDLITYGEVQRAALGVTISNLSYAKAKEMGLTISQGVMVDSVLANSAAGAAGIKSGDIIVKIDDRQIKTMPQLQETISTRKPGDEVKVVVVRDGKEKTINVPLKLRSTDERTVAKMPSNSVLRSLGADFKNLSSDDVKKLGVKGGVRVNKLFAGKLRSETDMREGFIITEINRKPVRSVEELTEILESEGGEGGVLIAGVYPGDSKVYYYGFGM